MNDFQQTGKGNEKMSDFKEGKHDCFRFGVEILSRYGRVGVSSDSMLIGWKIRTRH